MLNPDTPADPVDVAGQGALEAVLRTSHGEVRVRLFERAARRTVDNFAALALGTVAWSDAGEARTGPLYPGTRVHRVVPGVAIQLGCPRGDGSGGPGYRFADEVARSLRFDRAGRLAMASAAPGGNGSQFFITLTALPWLDGRHPIFGQVTSGMHVVEAIAAAAVDEAGAPLTVITLDEVSLGRADC